MKVILTENVDKLGQAGETREVANGYARNFLFPRNLAIPATKGAMQDVTNRRATAERHAQAQMSAAQTQVQRLSGLKVLLYARTGEQNRLYGSITAADVAEALRVQHHQTVDRRRIKLDSAIHRTGTYGATITVGQNLTAPVTLVVEPETSRGAALTSIAPSAPAPPAPPAPPPAPVEAEAVSAEAPAAEAPEAEAPTAEAPTAEAPAEPVAAAAESSPAEAPAPEVDAAAAESDAESDDEESDVENGDDEESETDDEYDEESDAAADEESDADDEDSGA